MRKLVEATFFLTVLLIGIAFFPALAGAHDQVPAPPQEGPVLLQGGDLYTVSGGVLEATDLLFEDGVIQAIGKALEVPEGAEVVDVSGHRVYPGLIAPLTTLGLTEIGAVRATRDLEEVGEITPEVTAHVAYNPDSELIPTVRSHGVTTVQVVPQGDLLRGRSMITHLDGWTKEDSAVEMVDALHLTWVPTEVRRGWWIEIPPEEQEKQMAEARQRLHQAFADARAYHLAKEADPELPVDLRWEAMRPVLDGEMPIFIAADSYRQIVEAVEFARGEGLDLVLTGGADAHLATDLLVENEVPVILGTITSLPEREDDDYDLPFRLPSLLHEAGVEFCLSHSNFGGSWDNRNLPFQAGQAVAFGLPQDAALRALTLGAAEILGIDDRLGSLEVGKEATLFISEGDVMDTLTQNVTAMYIEGRPVDLDNRHKELERKYRERISRR